MTPLPVGMDDVRSAADRISGIAHRTTLIRSRTLDLRVGSNVYLKPENFQRSGSFKFRGAFNAVSRLSVEQLRRGVVAYSSGNHAQALALACRDAGTAVVVVVPDDVAPAKRAAMLGYGAQVVSYNRFTSDRAEVCARIADERGLVIVPPFEHLRVIAGQGTVAMEMLQDAPDCDVIVVPVSGGGLIAGCAIAATALSPSLKVIGVEPSTADDTRQSLAAGRRVTIDVPDTIADGLRAVTPGELTYSINSRLLDDVVVAEDDEIAEAMRFAFERLKIVLEPSGAVALAAVLAGRVTGSNIGVVLSGGNVDPARFAEIVTRTQGRST